MTTKKATPVSPEHAADELAFSSVAVLLSETAEAAPPISEQTLADLEAAGAFGDMLDLVRETLDTAAKASKTRR